MAYRRRNGYGRRNFKRFRPGYNRRTGYYARNKARRFGGLSLRRVESKFYDVVLSDTTIGAPGQFFTKVSAGPEVLTFSLNDIPQGTGESQRIGRKCTITKIHMRLNFEFLAVETPDLVQASNAHETIRFMLIWDKQCNGTAGASLDVVETNVYNSYRNLANSKRFVILYDMLRTFNTTAVAEGNGTTKASRRVIRDYQVNVTKKLWIPIEFDGTTGDITEIKSNNIQTLCWSKHGGRMLLNDSQVRIRFIDQ